VRIPVFTNKTINTFKWKDWSASLGVELDWWRVPTLYNAELLPEILRRKTPLMGPRMVNHVTSTCYALFQQKHVRPGIIRKFNKIKQSRPYLSGESLLDHKISILLEKLEQVREKYPLAEARGEHEQVD
jgi:hypothetical protein